MDQPVSGLFMLPQAAGIDYNSAPEKSAGKAVYGTKKFLKFLESFVISLSDYLAPRIFSLGGNYINKLTATQSAI